MSNLDLDEFNYKKRKMNDVDLLHVGPYLQHSENIYIKDVKNNVQLKSPTMLFLPI